MSKSMLFGLAGLCVFAAVIMFMIGMNSSHMSELAEFAWVPIPLAVVCLIGGALKKKT